MKSKIKILAIAALAIVTSITANTVKANENITVMNEIKSFNKLSVAGNVDVYIVQSPFTNVKVYDNYYANNALVQEKNGELRISNFSKNRLAVAINTNNLNEINASGEANIITYGKLKTINLEVNLSDKAKANLNTETLDLFANLENNASLTLTGNTNEYNVILDNYASVKTDQFKSENSNIVSKDQQIANQTTLKNELPNLEF